MGKGSGTRGQRVCLGGVGYRKTKECKNVVSPPAFKNSFFLSHSCTLVSSCAPSPLSLPLQASPDSFVLVSGALTELLLSFRPVTAGAKDIKVRGQWGGERGRGIAEGMWVGGIAVVDAPVVPF